MDTTKEVASLPKETEETFFKRTNPDPFVQMAFRMLDISAKRQVSDQEVEEKLSQKAQLEVEQRIRDEKVYKALTTRWGVPARIIKNLRELDETRAVEVIREFQGSPPEGWSLILSADKGTGKSTAAALWLMSHVQDVHINTNLKQIRRWWTGTRLARVSSYGAEFEKICALPTMVIDDLGVEYLDKNGNFLQKLDELIDERYSNFRKTIITTNLNANHFRDRYGERVADRIREGFEHGGAFIELSETSMRTRPK